MTRLIGTCALFFALVAGSAAADQKQIDDGKALYGKYCASCHGDNGQGGKKAPPVVGKDALPLDPPAHAKQRKTQFHTAADVAAFVVKYMPAKKPGSLKEDEYWAILAFDLSANGVAAAAGQKIGPDTAAKIVLH
jgi:mono/diheme cytochrome c family protein